MSKVRLLLAGLLLSQVGCDSPSEPVGVDPATDSVVIAEHNRAVAAMGAFDYSAAFEVLQPLAASHPNWAGVQVDLAIAELNRQTEGDEQTAMRRLEGVLAAHPDNLRARYTLGLLRLNAGDVEQAREDFRAVSLTDPSDAYAAYYLGQSMMQLGEVEPSLRHFEQAIELDPYLRSAYYAGSQAARRVGQADRSAAWLDVFQRMEHNPRGHLAEIKYTRMGPKAELVAIAPLKRDAAPRPSGPIFDVEASSHRDCDHCPSVTSLSAGWTDQGHSHVLISNELGSQLYEWSADNWLRSIVVGAADGATQLQDVSMVQASLWGDVDGDGHVDVVLCRAGENQLWLGRGAGVFEQDPRFSGGSPGNSRDGAVFDADHDGDLDVLVVNDGGTPCELLNNNGDGTWQSVVDEQSGFPMVEESGRQVVVADFDGDLDTDVLLISQSPPHRAWVNDRLWHWRNVDETWSNLLNADIAAAVAADMDADGNTDLVTIDSEHTVRVWSLESAGWTATVLARRPVKPAEQTDDARQADRPRQMAVADVTGDGWLEVLLQSRLQTGDPAMLQILSRTGNMLQEVRAESNWMLVHDKQGKGPTLVSAGEHGTIVTIPPGTGRWPFVDVMLAGRNDLGQSMRSNSSGIGAAIAARVADRWTITGTIRNSAGPGQNLQPVSIGLGDADVIDFVSIDWSDGVLQTESQLLPGKLHEITETQRQLSSCPVIFAWDGSSMQFQTDCLGVGGLGFFLAPGQYAPPRPRERVLLPGPSLGQRGGMLEVVLAEPMQETCYLDAVALEIIDVPPGWEVLPDERMGTNDPMPTSELLYSARSLRPILASRGRDVLNAVHSVDGIAADPGLIDSRFIGRVLSPLELELEFAEPLDSIGERLVMVLDGWVEYPYSQTMFAAWQAGAGYSPITIEARIGDGQWSTVHTDIGYPAGMQRTCVLPLNGVPRGSTELRIRCDLELYVDAVRVAAIEPCPQARVHRRLPVTAVLEQPGYPRRLSLPQRRPGYDWDDQVPFWDVRSQRGEYTRLGDVRSIVALDDQSVAVFGAGEAIRCRFAPPPRIPRDWNRQVVLDVQGWCKDMDLMTRDGGTVDPVPWSAPLRDRHRSGR